MAQGVGETGGSVIDVKANRCKKCGHVWLHRSQRELGQTRVCPKCKSYSWSKPGVKPRRKRSDNLSSFSISCAKCGYQWISKKLKEGKGAPKECPKCKTYQVQPPRSRAALAKSKPQHQVAKTKDPRKPARYCIHCGTLISDVAKRALMRIG